MLHSVCLMVYQKFPEVAGVAPREHSQPNNQTLLVFQNQSVTSDGKQIKHSVRVVVSTQGKIIKMSTSR